VSGRIDLAARLGPALTAYIGVRTRGVRAAHTHTFSTGCQDGPRARRLLPGYQAAGSSAPNVAQACRPIGADDRFQPCLGLRCGGLDRTVVPAYVESNREGSVLHALDTALVVRRRRGQRRFQLNPARRTRPRVGALVTTFP
jgi:hypothetical protein